MQELLGNTACSSLRQLARELGEPLSTVDRRYRRLQTAGVIMGGYYEVNLRALGVESYRILLACRGLSQDLHKALFAFARSHPRVTFIIESLGPWDYEIVVEAERAAEVMAITQQIYEVCGHRLNSVKMLTEIEELKSSYYPKLK